MPIVIDKGKIMPIVIDFMTIVIDFMTIVIAVATFIN